MSNQNAELVNVSGTVFEYTGSKSGKGKNGNWVIHKFVITNAEGESFKCQTFDAFDPAWVGEEVSFDAAHDEQYNSYTAKTPVVLGAAPEGGPALTSSAKATPKAYTKKFTPKSSSGDGVDWAAKDRSMNAGGLMHDAAAITAALLDKKANATAAIALCEEIALGLADVKVKLEEKIKG